MSDTSELSRLWADVASRLPPGWSLDGLRCASTGLAPDERSEEWVAVAIGPDGEERTFGASEPHDALLGLAAAFD